MWKQCPDTPQGLECTSDGEFRYNGRRKAVIFCFRKTGERATARVTMHKDGKHLYWQAARLVARTWLPDYDDSDYLTYRDGNCHNISRDNLHIADKTEYYEYMRRNAVFKGNGDIEQRKRKLQLVIDEASCTLHYFKTLDMTPVNRHVEEYLYKCLMSYCMTTLHIGETTAQDIVPECLARMYECIMSGMCLYNYERYCKKLLHNYKKKGTFGLTGKVPRPIEIHVEQLNLNRLWERYKVTRFKRAL